jgi:hypothetical protein
MTGTNFTNGLTVRRKYSGNVDTVNGYALRADTKFVRKTAVIRCIGSEADASERTTAFTFPAKCIVHDVFINVITVDATETVDVGTEGTSNDPNGFLAAASLATAGLVKGSLLDGSVTRGALLFEETGTGADVANAPTVSITTGGDPVSFTASAGTDTAVFDIIIDYTEVVEEVR